MNFESEDAVCKTVSDLTQEKFHQALKGTGVGIQIGPFAVCIQAKVRVLHEALYALYEHYPLLPNDSLFSMYVSLKELRKPPLFRRFVRFSVDGRVPHEDLPADQALAVLEWGINLVIALRSHCYLMLHSAVVEKDGAAVVLPGEPGSGKSTLCAAMAYRGWRLLSDEFGLVRARSSDFVSIPRPVSLKNESIDVIRAYIPDASLGPVIPNTRKGDVAHVKPPTQSIRDQGIKAKARWVVFPCWERNVPLNLEPVPKSEGFMMLARNAFNYELLGEEAFCIVRDIVNGASFYRLTYSDLDEAINCLNDLAGDHERN